MRHFNGAIAVAITSLALFGSTLPGATAVGTGPGTVELAGIYPDGTVAPSATPPLLSGDGTKLVLNRTNPGSIDGYSSIYLRDLMTGTTRPLLNGTDGNLPNGNSQASGLSDNGRYVAYASTAGNISASPAPITEPGPFRAFRMDTVTGKSTRVDKLPGGGLPTEDSWTQSISPNGRYVTFMSFSPNLFAGDFNYSADLFLRDMQTGTTVLVGRRPDGGLPINAYDWASQVTADGNTVFFSTDSLRMGVGPAGNHDLFRWDRATNQTSVVTARPDGTAYGLHGTWDVSSTGTWAALRTAESLVAEDTDGVENNYRLNTSTLKARRLTAATDDAEGADGTLTPQISPDGQCIGFKDISRGRATLYYPATRQYRHIPTGYDGLAPGPGTSTLIIGISRGCSTVILESQAKNLVVGAPATDEFLDYVWRDN